MKHQKKPQVFVRSPVDTSQPRVRNALKRQAKVSPGFKEELKAVMEARPRSSQREESPTIQPGDSGHLELLESAPGSEKSTEEHQGNQNRGKLAGLLNDARDRYQDDLRTWLTGKGNPISLPKWRASTIQYHRERVQAARQALRDSVPVTKDYLTWFLETDIKLELRQNVGVITSHPQMRQQDIPSFRSEAIYILNQVWLLEIADAPPNQPPSGDDSTPQLDSDAGEQTVAERPEFRAKTHGIEIGLIVSYFKAGQRDQETLAKSLTNRAHVKYSDGRTPLQRYRENPSAFRTHCWRMRKRAEKIGIYDSVPVDYYLKYIS